MHLMTAGLHHHVFVFIVIRTKSASSSQMTGKDRQTDCRLMHLEADGSVFGASVKIKIMIMF
jgi:hypothetical protein